MDKSEGHVERWRGFHLPNPGFVDFDEDERFSKWVRRYLDGDWHVDNGPASHVIKEIALINGLSREAVGDPLFALEQDPHISYPTAQNTHRYEDAHADLYRILQDGLDKRCIEALAMHLGRPLNAANLRPLTALSTTFPTTADEVFEKPWENISRQRGRSAHKQRPPATSFHAFEEFTKDLYDVHGALTLLRTILEKELKLDADYSRRRQDALDRLPRIGRPPEPNRLINKVARMQGKTVESVEYGFRHDIQGVHESEVIVIRFTDGSIMSLDTFTNANHILRMTDGQKHEASEVHVGLDVRWVPPKKPRS
jgi:hypothetical protein